jgi:hypothetical protein
VFQTSIITVEGGFVAVEAGDYRIILIASAILLATCLAIIALSLKAKTGALRATARELRERFFSEVAGLRQKRDELSEYTPEYYHAFQEGGWRELNEILEALAYVEGTIDLCLVQRRFKEAALLCRYLLAEVTEEELARAQSMFAHLKRIENWKSDTREILVQLSKTVGAAATETRKLGVNRNRRRKSTLDTIADILAHDRS